MAIHRPVYTTREEVKTTLDVQQTARTDRQVDQQIEAASVEIDKIMHRSFVPTLATYTWDWPTIQAHWPWRLWLNQLELAAPPSAVSSGGISIPTDQVRLYPTSGPPYNRIELDLATTASFSAGQTWQQSISMTGTYGYGVDEIAAGTLAADLASNTTTVNLGAPLYRGVGSILRIDSERMIVSDRATVSTGTTLQGTITGASNVTAVPVSDITQYAVGETLLIDAEYMLVVDAAGSNLIVKRATNGSVLAAHTLGATIYAPRQVTLIRGALGTTAAAHTSGAAIAEHDAPALIRQLATAQAVVWLIYGKAGWPAASGRISSRGVSQNQPPPSYSELRNLWDQAETAYRRKARLRSA